MLSLIAVCCTLSRLARMFSKCKNLKNLNISEIDTSNVTDMSYMFSYCEQIKNLDTIYHNYISNSNNIYDKEIDKDLLRTLPNDSSFQRGSSRYQKLFNILKAYSNYNDEIGYAQGMNFIVAKLIKFFLMFKNKSMTRQIPKSI